MAEAGNELQEIPTIIDAEVAQVTEAEQLPKPSREAWEALLQEASRGNSMFPQAFLAQGIRMADGIIAQAEKEDLPVQSFLDTNPPRALINGMVASSRDKMHAAYGIKTNPTRVIPVDSQLENVWDEDKNSARTVLAGFGRVFYETQRGDPGTLSDATIIDAVQNDPLFRDLISYAAEGLESHEVRTIARAYRTLIAEFSKKYAGYTYPDIPDGYAQEQRELMASLRNRIEISSVIIAEEVLKQTTEQHPEQSQLIAKLTDIDEDTLVGPPWVSVIHPLRNPDAEI